jgi:hypothetical protein
MELSVSNELKVTGLHGSRLNVQKRAATESKPPLTPEESWLQEYKPILDDLHHKIAVLQGDISKTKNQFKTGRRILTTDPNYTESEKRLHWGITDAYLRRLPGQQGYLADLTQRYVEAVDRTRRELLDSDKVGEGELRERILRALRRLPGEGIEKDEKKEGAIEVGPE